MNADDVYKRVVSDHALLVQGWMDNYDACRASYHLKLSAITSDTELLEELATAHVTLEGRERRILTGLEAHVDMTLGDDRDRAQREFMHKTDRYMEYRNQRQDQINNTKRRITAVTAEDRLMTDILDGLKTTKHTKGIKIFTNIRAELGSDFIRVLEVCMTRLNTNSTRTFQVVPCDRAELVILDIV
jgi:hypothetical protein